MSALKLKMSNYCYDLPYKFPIQLYLTIRRLNRRIMRDRRLEILGKAKVFSEEHTNNKIGQKKRESQIMKICETQLPVDTAPLQTVAHDF